MEPEKTSIRIEGKLALDKVRHALATNGLKITSTEEYPTLGFENPEEGYAVFVGGILPKFKKEYHKTMKNVARSYYVRSTLLHDGRNCRIKEEKRDILARRVMLKRAIASLDTRVEEQREEQEGGDYIIDSYYKICIENTKIGFFIKNPKGDVFPAGF